MLEKPHLFILLGFSKVSTHESLDGQSWLVLLILATHTHYGNFTAQTVKTERPLLL